MKQRNEERDAQLATILSREQHVDAQRSLFETIEYMVPVLDDAMSYLLREDLPGGFRAISVLKAEWKLAHQCIQPASARHIQAEPFDFGAFP